MVDHDIMGLSYEQASRKALELVEKAAKTGNWFAIVDTLAELKHYMVSRAAYDQNAGHC